MAQLKGTQLQAAVKATTHVYVGTKKCGCNVAVCADIPGLEPETAKSVAEFIRHGYTVTRYHMVDDKEKAKLKLCECDKPPAEQLLFT